MPSLIVALFDSYDHHKAERFAELMWLVEALYAALPEMIDKTDASRILAATRHSCGHGGVEEPLRLAKTAFSDGHFTREFFDAVRTYQGRLAGLRSTEVTRARGEIACLLWLDPEEPLHPASCLSAGIREGYFSLESDHKQHWTRVFQLTDRTARRKLDRKWIAAARVVLNTIGDEPFTATVDRWLRIPDGNGKVPLSTSGRHVLKTLIWFCALCESPNVDHMIPRLIDLQYVDPKAAVHLIYATGYWLDSRPSAFSDTQRERLRRKWPKATTHM